MSEVYTTNVFTPYSNEVLPTMPDTTEISETIRRDSSKRVTSKEDSDESTTIQQGSIAGASKSKSKQRKKLAGSSDSKSDKTQVASTRRPTRVYSIDEFVGLSNGKEEESVSKKKVRAISLQVFTTKLLLKESFVGGNPIFADLSKYGLFALRAYVGNSKSLQKNISVESISAEMELRKISIKTINEECKNLQSQNIRSCGKEVYALCKKKLNDVREAAKQEEFVVQEEPVVQEVVVVKEEPAKQQESDAIPVMAQISEESSKQQELTAKHEEPAIQQEKVASQLVEPIVQHEGPTVQEASVSCPVESVIQQPPVQEEIRSKIIRMWKTNVPLPKIIDSIDTLEDYHDFIEIVKATPGWTTDKGLRLYLLMAPVDKKLWKSVGVNMPVDELINNALVNRFNKKFSDRPFDNAICLYLELIVGWLVSNGCIKRKEVVDFFEKRKRVYAEYNNFISSEIRNASKPVLAF